MGYSAGLGEGKPSGQDGQHGGDRSEDGAKRGEEIRGLSSRLRLAVHTSYNITRRIRSLNICSFYILPLELIALLSFWNL